jgi:23S rRNA pseudouridine955/2504/2580 synthase/23S rRNA pseudouridine1911/1915/1917 synthase
MKRKTATKVASEGAGIPLLEYLAARFTYFGREEWMRQIDGGRVSVNGRLAGMLEPLSEGDLVSFDVSAFREPPVDSSVEIVMEDEDFLVVDKSGSLPCHPGGRFFEHSLWFILRQRYGAIHIATRLDRETSGLVLACKSPRAARLAQEMLSSGRLEKRYLALVHGCFPESVEACGYLSMDEDSAIRKKRKYFEEGASGPGPGREACETKFQLVERRESQGGALSLVKAFPLTGRTHQIRATLFSLGYPLVGDKLYGLDEGLFLRFASGTLSPEDRSLLILPAQALHCAELRFFNSAGLPVVALSRPPWL